MCKGRSKQLAMSQLCLKKKPNRCKIEGSVRQGSARKQEKKIRYSAIFFKLWNALWVKAEFLHLCGVGVGVDRDPLCRGRISTELFPYKGSLSVIMGVLLSKLLLSTSMA